MAVSFNDTQRRYDRLIQLIIQELDRLFDDLLADKKKHEILRDTIAHKVHAQKMLFVADKKAEMVTKAEENLYTISQKQLDQITRWQEELGQLIVQEINIERRKAITIKDDPARIDNEITIIKEIIAYLKDNAGNKGKRRGLTREAGNALHDKIKDVYDSVLTREEEANLTKTHFEPLKQKIEEQETQIINLIGILLNDIPGAGPSGGPSGAGPSGGPSGAGPSGGPSVDVPVNEPSDDGTGPEAVVDEPPVDVPVNEPSGDGAGPVEVTEDEAKAIEDDVDDAERVLETQRGWFLRVWDSLGKLRTIAGSKIAPKQKLKKAQLLLKKMSRFESREQFRASVSKLTGKLQGLMKRPSISPSVKQNIVGLVQKLKIFEGKSLRDTVKGLGEKLKRGTSADEVDFEGVGTDVDSVGEDVRAVVALDKRLKEQLGKVIQGVRSGVSKSRGRIAGAGRTVKGTSGGWYSSLSGTAGRLAVAARSKANIGGAVGNVKAFGGRSLQSANAGVGNLLGRAKGVVKMPSVDVRARERISGLANRLGTLQSSISNKIRNLPGLRNGGQAEQTASEISGEAAEARSIAQRLKSELCKVGQVPGGAGRGVKRVGRVVKGTIGGWYSSLSGTAGRLTGAARSKANIGGAVGNVKAFGGRSLQSANAGVRNLLGRAKGVVKMPSVDVRARERISGLGTQLKSLQTEVSEGVSKLKPGLPRNQISGIAASIRENSTRAAAIAEGLARELARITKEAAKSTGRGIKRAGKSTGRGVRRAGAGRRIRRRR